MKVIYYWSPCLTPVGTVKSTINSAVALSKYNKDYQVKILNVFGEWDEYKSFLDKNDVEILDLVGFNYKNFLPKYGFIGSRFSYFVIMFISIFPLFKILKKTKPDYLIIHLLTSIPLLLFNLFNFDTKLILRISGFPKLNFFRKLLWRRSKNLIFKITCPSKELLSDLESLSIFPKNKLSLLYDAIINVKEFRKKKYYQKLLPENFTNKNFFLSIGRFTKQKNYIYLVKEFAKFYQKNPDEKLLIIGNGELKDNIKKEIDKLNLSNSIKILSQTDNVYYYMRKSKGFILSSLWEEIGFVIVEAAMSNTAVISSDCKNGPKEFLTYGKGGFLYESNKSDSLSVLLNSFIKTDSSSLIKKRINAKKNCKNFSMFGHQIILSKILS